MEKLTIGKDVVAEIADAGDLFSLAKERGIPELDNVVVNPESKDFDQWDTYLDGTQHGYDRDGRVFLLSSWYRITSESPAEGKVVYAQRFCIYQVTFNDKSLVCKRFMPVQDLFINIDLMMIDILTDLADTPDVSEMVYDGVTYTMTPCNGKEARRLIKQYFVMHRGLNPIAAGKRTSNLFQTEKPIPIVKAKDSPAHEFMKKMADQDSPAIDMWKENSEVGGSRTFGYWETHTAAYDDRAKPEMTVEIPIVENGNYIGDPSNSGFEKWRKACLKDKKQFTITGYHRFMEKLYNERDKRLSEKADKKAADHAENERKRFEKAAKKEKLAKEKAEADRKLDEEYAERRRVIEEEIRVKDLEKAKQKKKRDDERAILRQERADKAEQKKLEKAAKKQEKKDEDARKKAVKEQLKKDKKNKGKKGDDDDKNAVSTG